MPSATECPHCGLTNPPGTAVCAACSTPLPRSGVPVSGPASSASSPSTPSSFGDETLPSTSGWSAPASSIAASTASLSALEPGRVLGTRYEILQLLGEGGMGSVYKARDTAVDRLVAIKVIRPDLANRPDILARFKQELVLARQVTHKNVIRIFDLGEAEGLKFITMDFIEGCDLKSILREKGKLSPNEATSIVTQICRALDAAHSEGVVHRDLKPQNIMIDARGRVTVMDFGIARSMEMTGTTQTGSLVGTPEYMSPEQAKGEDVDARSDLFTLGIIFYELLTGETPFYAETAYATLLKRTQERARDPVELDPTIPPQISRVVMKCLETNRDQRYGSALEIIRDLGQQTVTASRTALPAAAATQPATTPFSLKTVWSRQQRLWVAGGVLLLFIVAAVAYGMKHGFRPATNSSAAGPSVSLAILPFDNGSGDPSLDWLGPSLADMLSTDVGQSSHVRAVSPGRVQQIMHDLQISPGAFSDVATVRRLAEMSNADTIVWGRYAKFGEQFRVDATLRDIKHDRDVSFKVEAANQQDLLKKVDGLAQTIRDNLALQPNIADELKAQSFKPSSTSVDAMRFYSQGTNLYRQGKNLEALKDFQAATQADPNFALAYAKLGQTFANIGHDAEAEEASRKAVELSENLPARERYVIAASDARIQRDYPKAIEYYENLAASAPGDLETQFELGRLYEDSGAVDKAHDHYSKVLAGDPNNVDALLALGRLQLRQSDPTEALRYFNQALPLSIQFGNDEAEGTLLQGIGVSYRQLDKGDEALTYFQQALEVRQKLGDKRGVARTLEVIAQIQDQNGKSDEALKGYQQVLQLRQEIGDKSGIGDALLDLGGFHLDRDRYDQALGLYKEALQVERELGNESSQGLCLNNIGLAYLSKTDYENALTYFQQALDMRQKSQVPEDIALTLHNLALTYEDLGQFDKALSNYERALELYRNAGDKSGVAMQSYTMGRLFGYQGRFGAAINAKQEALKSFTEMHDRTYWMTEVMSGYGKALADAGRFDDAQKPLDDSLALARELKIDGSIAQALDFQGECLFYRGDLKGARNHYDQAMQFALRSKDQEKILLTKFHIAQAMLTQGKASEAAVALRKVAADADSLGMKYLSFEASVYLGESLVESKQYDRARPELERGIAAAEKLELRPVLAQAHYSLATALRLSGHRSDATLHYRDALQYLDEIRKDVGSDSILKRSDLSSVYAESNRWAKALEAR
jgi:eukaryotic-like serine/threonine-protein kinase